MRLDVRSAPLAVPTSCHSPTAGQTSFPTFNGRPSPVRSGRSRRGGFHSKRRTRLAPRVRRKNPRCPFAGEDRSGRLPAATRSDLPQLRTALLRSWRSPGFFPRDSPLERTWIRTPRSRSVIGELPGYPPAKPSGKVPDTHSVGSICDHDFGVFTVTNIATENTDAVPPAHAVPRMPKAANRGLQRCRGPRAPLTCLAPLTAWQSLCTGHVNASLENCVALAFADGNRPSGNNRLPSALRRSARLFSATVRPSRKQAGAFRLRQDLGTLGAYYEDVRWWGSGKGTLPL
jgi:hypothetical protein